METPAQQRQKMGVIIAVVMSVLVFCCLFVGILALGMGPVLDRVYSSIDASMALTPSP